MGGKVLPDMTFLKIAKSYLFNCNFGLFCTILAIFVKCTSGLLFPTQFRFRALFFCPVQFRQKMYLFGSPSGNKIFFQAILRSKLFLFGPVSGPIFKGRFEFSEFNLIFWGLIIQEIEFLVGFWLVFPHFR